MPLISVGANITLNSEGTTGAVVPSQAVLIGANDGTNLQGITTYQGVDGASSGKIGLYTGATLIATSNNNGTGGLNKIEQMQYFSTTGLSANGAGTSRSHTLSPYSTFSMQVVRTAGASAYVVDLEGSQDGANWVQLGSLSSSSATDMLHVVNKVVRYHRYNITTIGGGNTLSVITVATKF